LSVVGMAKSSAYPTLDGLFDLACRDGVDIRPTLLRVLTDLYVQKPSHSADEEAQFVELAGRLLETVDAATRAIVKARLSAYRAAPAAILRKLAAPDPRPAGEAAPVRKAEPTQPDLAELFFSASAPERRLILINLDLVAESPTLQPPRVAAELIGRLENAALQRNTGEFGRTLARALDLSQALAERIGRDYSGEPIVVAAKALGMTADVLQRILLFLNPVIGQSVERVYDLSRLYDEITAAAAGRMVAIWRQTGARAKPSHAPLHYDDERRGARAAATPAEHRTGRSRHVLPPPAKSNSR
jgi:uncharacterized protein (DUF2336 family)